VKIEGAIFFASPAEFRAWLEAHHASAEVLWVGFHRKGTGRPSLTWPQSVDEALCFGWIDGVRKSIDAERYAIRFTPRRPRSIWSAVNTRRMAELEAEGRMTEAGRRVFAARDPKRANAYSFENRPRELPAEALAKLAANRRAAAFWERQPPGYRRVVAFWVTSAKREETRERRLQELIACSARGERVGLLQRPARKKS
jgi:uncharacterized protein YdeI (YjbR/CyaY-like superfamily)